MNPSQRGASHGSSPPSQPRPRQPAPPLPPPPPPPSDFDEPIPANLRKGSKGSKKSTGKPKTLQPAVIWDDRQSSSGEQQTFYAEGTPPSSPSLRPYQSNTSVGAGGYPFASSLGDEIGSSSYGGNGVGGESARKVEAYDYKYDRVAPPAPIPERTKFGLKKRTFWIVVAAVALVVVIALAVGLGVGLSSKKGSAKKSGDKEGAESDSSSTEDPAATVTTTTTDLTSTAVTTAEATYTLAPSQACPAANNTVFDVPESDKSFRRFCGRDYRDGQGADDVGVVWTASVIDCMVNCAGYPGCKGVGWGFIEGDKGDNHRCWMKKDIKEGEWTSARAGWDFAILVD